MSLIHFLATLTMPSISFPYSFIVAALDLTIVIIVEYLFYAIIHRYCLIRSSRSESRKDLFWDDEQEGCRGLWARRCEG